MARTDPRPHYGRKRRVGAGGYVYIYEPGHPLAHRDGYVAEHRKIAWDAGVLTDSALQIHHRNGHKTDNRIENLEVITAAEHPGRHELAGWARDNIVKTHCKRGHEFTPENTYRSSTGGRACRQCALDNAAARRAQWPACSAALGLR